MAEKKQLELSLNLKSNADKRLAVISKTGEKTGKSFKAAAEKGSAFSGSLVKIEKTGKKAEKSLKEISETGKSLKAAALNCDNFATSLRKIEINGNNAAKALKKACVFTKAFGNEKFSLEAQARKITGWANDISLQTQAFAQLGTLGGRVSAFGSRMVGSLSKPISAMARLENGMVSLKSVMLDANGSVKESFNGLSKAVIKTANKLPATADEMYQAAAGAVAHGMDAEALAKGGLADSAKFAVGVLGNDYNRALEIANLISQSWNVKNNKLAGDFGVYDMLTRASSMGVNVEDMATMIAKTGAGAAALGSSGYDALIERMPFLVMLKKQLAGMSAEVLSSNLSQLESRVMDKNAVNKAGTAAGVKLQFTDKDGRYKGFNNLVAQLEKLNGLSDEKRTKAIQTLFGSSANMSALVSTLMTSGIKGAAGTKAEMGEKASLENRVGTQLETFSAQWNAFTGTLDTSMGKIGMVFNPVLKDCAGLATKAAEALGGFAEKHPDLTKGIGYATLLTGGLTMAAGKGLQIASQVGMAMPLFEKLGPHIGKGAKALAGFLHANWQLILIGAGVASLVYVFSQLTDITTDVGRDFAVLYSGLDGLKAVLGKIKGFFRYIFNGFEIDEESAAASLKVDDVVRNNPTLLRDIEAAKMKKEGDKTSWLQTINIDARGMNPDELIRKIQEIQRRNASRSYAPAN